MIQTDSRFWLTPLGLGAASVALFLRLTSRGKDQRAPARPQRSERARRLTFSLISLAAGPLIGLAFAIADHVIQDLEPIDLPGHYAAIITLGTIGGLMAGGAFAAASLLTLLPRRRTSTEPPQQ